MKLFRSILISKVSFTFMKIYELSQLKLQIVGNFLK